MKSNVELEEQEHGLLIKIANIKPDVVTLAKGLASGVPIGACIANEKASSLMAHLVSMALHLGVTLGNGCWFEDFRNYEEESLLDNALSQGQLIVSLLKKEFEHNDKIILLDIWV